MVMRFMAQFILIIAMFSSVSVFADDEISIFDVTDGDGIRRVYYTSEAILLKEKEWIPDKDDTPLRIPVAAQIAKDYVLKQYPKFEDLNVREVQIYKIGGKTGINKWFYVFSFDPKIYGESYLGTNIRAVVLMSGTVIPSRIEKTRERK